MQAEQIAAETDRCVKCGLCLPACPTYRRTGNEAESPRGRVALIQGLVAGRLQDSRGLRAHLDLCLGCQACETACPSGVAVVPILDAARALHRQRLPFPLRWPRRFWLRLLSDRRLRTPLFRLATGWRRGRFTNWLAEHGIAAISPHLRRIYGLVPDVFVPESGRTTHPPDTELLGQVTLFTGCVAQVTEPQVTNAAIRLLTRLGYAVSIPGDQACCGAMHEHNGEPAAARKLAQRNLEAFADPQYPPVLSTASGCASHLRTYSRLAEMPEADRFSSRVADISQFLCDAVWPAQARLKPLHARAMIHDPCSLRNALGQAKAPYRLLSRIPGLSIEGLPGNEFCCGAAGTYLLQHPKMSDALLATKLEGLRGDPPDLLLTSNPGCALHLAAGIRELGLEIQVLHPLQLIEQQLVIGA